MQLFVKLLWCFSTITNGFFCAHGHIWTKCNLITLRAWSLFYSGMCVCVFGSTAFGLLGSTEIGLLGSTKECVYMCLAHIYVFGSTEIVNVVGSNICVWLYWDCYRKYQGCWLYSIVLKYVCLALLEMLKCRKFQSTLVLNMKNY